MIEPAGSESAAPRAFLRVGGISLARLQLGVVLALGCERIVCIARGLQPELVELQHVAEINGARFHVVSSPRGLTGLVTANDELIVLADGLLVVPAEAVAQLEAGQGVLVQPIETGQPAGFERIDLNHAGAGAMRVPGGLIERLTELPPDCDAVSAIQRIAMQAGLPQRMLAGDLRERGGWRLVRDEAEAQAAEADWFRRHTAAGGTTVPSVEAARLAVRAMGPALMHSGSGGNAIGALALAATLLALGAAWLGFVATALFLCAAADILGHAATLLLRIERQSLNLPRSIVPRELVFGWSLDVALILVLAWSQPAAQGQGPLMLAFPAVMFVAMVRLVPQVFQSSRVAWLNDRGLIGLSLGLVALVAGGMPESLIAVLTAALAAIAVAGPRGQLRLTRA